MSPRHSYTFLSLPLALGLAGLCSASPALAQAPPGARNGAVLVELFTSEGCSSCPPADELLRQVSGHTGAAGQLIIGISEHVSYWNDLGWKDPFSSEQYTARQNDYSHHFGLGSVYTPQMVVNGREQFVGGDRRSLDSALASEGQRKQIALHILGAQVADKNLVFRYSAADLPEHNSLHLVAVLVDDLDRSDVLHGENSGRDLVHVSVARSLAPLGRLEPTEGRSVTLPLPPSFFTAPAKGHHLVLFAQQAGSGAVLGTDTLSI